MEKLSQLLAAIRGGDYRLALRLAFEVAAEVLRGLEGGPNVVMGATSAAAYSGKSLGQLADEAEQVCQAARLAPPAEDGTFGAGGWGTLLLPIILEIVRRLLERA